MKEKDLIQRFLDDKEIAVLTTAVHGCFYMNAALLDDYTNSKYLLSVDEWNEFLEGLTPEFFREFNKDLDNHITVENGKWYYNNEKISQVVGEYGIEGTRDCVRTIEENWDKFYKFNSLGVSGLTKTAKYGEFSKDDYKNLGDKLDFMIRQEDLTDKVNDIVDTLTSECKRLDLYINKNNAENVTFINLEMMQDWSDYEYSSFSVDVARFGWRDACISNDLFQNIGDGIKYQQKLNKEESRGFSMEI